MSSATMLNDNGSAAQLNPTGRASPAPSRIAGYDRYLASGPQPEIEMARLDYDQQPLLHAAVSAPSPSLTHCQLLRDSPSLVQQAPGYYEADMASRSALSLSQYGGGSPYGTPQMEFAPPMPPQMAAPAAFETGAEQGYRQAPVYRPTPPRDGAWQ